MVLGGRTIGPAPARYARRLAGSPPVVLRQDQLHGPLEHGPRRSGPRGEPLLELGLLYAKEASEFRAPALQMLALLEDARAHLSPTGLMNHPRW